ncbi:MAG: anaerobic carbon-monoxide dehydrogenase catalytic subunit [Bacillota bacterium]
MHNWENLTMDPAAGQMLEKARADGVTTVFDRYAAQQPQCRIGLSGLCCRLCVQGPCRINPSGKAQKGICGASADQIVARYLLRGVASGAACHVDHSYEAVEALYLASQGKIPYEIRDTDKLKAVAGKLGIATEGKSAQNMAREVAETAFGDFASHNPHPMRWLTATAPAERVETWRKLGILPRNPDREVREALHQTANGGDADPVNMLLAAGKLGLVDGYAGLHLGTDMQDILFGTPQPVQTEANLGVLKEDHVNIVVHGHIPLLSIKVVEWAGKLEHEAKALGAKGIQVAGICCSGNEVLMRHGVPSAGNYLQQELAIVTGAVDAMVVDIQCIMPSLADVAACYHTKIITTLPTMKMPGAEHVPFSLATADEDAQRIVRLALAAYQRRNPALVNIPAVSSLMWGGFSVEAILAALGTVNREDPLKPLVDHMASGQILGAVATVGCNSVKVPQDRNHVELVKTLLAENVLVVATGCSAHALAKAGLMTPAATEKYAGSGLKAVLTAVGQAAGLGGPLPPVLHMGSCVDNSRVEVLLSALAQYLKVRIQDLPVAASAPELQHEKALSIGTWAVMLGVFTHVGVMLPVGGSPLVTHILTADLEKLVGGKFLVETNPHRAAQAILDHIRAKRKGLGLEEAAAGAF